MVIEATTTSQRPCSEQQDFILFYFKGVGSPPSPIIITSLIAKITAFQGTDSGVLGQKATVSTACVLQEPDIG